MSIVNYRVALTRLKRTRALGALPEAEASMRWERCPSKKSDMQELSMRLRSRGSVSQFSCGKGERSLKCSNSFKRANESLQCLYTVVT